MTDDLTKLGYAFIRLGTSLKRGSDTGLDAETLSKLLALGRLIPEPFTDRANAPWTEEKDPAAIEILEKIKNGESIPTDRYARENDMKLFNTLLRLKRNGLILNRGSRIKPDWCLATEEEREQIVSHRRDKRVGSSN